MSLIVVPRRVDGCVAPGGVQPDKPAGTGEPPRARHTAGVTGSWVFS